MSSSPWLGDFSAIHTAGRTNELERLKEPHKYIAKLFELEAKEEGKEFMDQWKWRTKKWTLEGLAHYDEEQEQPRKHVQKSPDDVHVLMPTGPMPENVAYIWPERSRMYCIKSYTLPDPDQENIDMPHREITKFRNAGFTVKAIAETVIDPPKTNHESNREAINSLEGRLSERDQNYRVVLGVFSNVRRKMGSGKDSNVYDILEWKSVAQLFHGVVGSIDPFRFKWSPPFDPMHNTAASNTFVEYDLPPPEDISAFDRAEIDKRRGKRGLKPLPSFATFLVDAELTFQRYFWSTYGRLHRNNVMMHFESEEAVLKAIEEERIAVWAKIKRWPAHKAQEAADVLGKIQSKEKRRGSLRLKRIRSDANIQLGDSTGSPAENNLGKQEAQTEKDSRSANMSATPRTPVQRRRPSSGLAQATPPSHQNHPHQSSPLSQGWSPSMADVRNYETATPGQRGSYGTDNYVMNEFEDYDSSPIAPYQSPQNTGFFRSPGQSMTPTGGQYSFAAGSARRASQQGDWNNSLSSMQTPPFGADSGNAYSPMIPPAPPGFNHIGINHTANTGNPFWTRPSFDQQQMRNQMQASRNMGGYQGHSSTEFGAPLRSNSSTEFGVPLGSNPADLRRRPVTFADLATGLGNIQQGSSNQTQVPRSPGYHGQGVQAASFGNQFAPQFAPRSSVAPRSGFAPSPGSTQHSNQAYQGGGSHNATAQNQSNFLLPSPMIGNNPSPATQESVHDNGEIAADDSLDKLIEDVLKDGEM
ncbi:hypothetical protein FKW77_005348 [Venturia effusa]|uniref:Uncharacterized protein n=1 Tax=Venturia effusa TaxID=50376 RepID=A0A517LLP1_9PEZI|nr:hypothetical protein FKW77_005348 [Venturia effusa]